MPFKLKKPTLSENEIKFAKQYKVVSQAGINLSVWNKNINDFETYHFQVNEIFDSLDIKKSELAYWIEIGKKIKGCRPIVAVKDETVDMESEIEKNIKDIDSGNLPTPEKKSKKNK